MRSATTLCVALAVLPSTLSAQNAWTPKFYVGGGADLHRPRGDVSLAGIGLSIHGGYFRQFARLGLRLGVAYHERGYTNDSVRIVIDYEGVAWHARTTAATVDATYDLIRAPARLYVLGGLEAYRVSSSSVNRNFQESHRSSHGVAAVPGWGLRFRIGAAEAFVEERFHRGIGGSQVVRPITVGIRF